MLSIPCATGVAGRCEPRSGQFTTPTLSPAIISTVATCRKIIAYLYAIPTKACYGNFIFSCLLFFIFFRYLFQITFGYDIAVGVRIYGRLIGVTSSTEPV